MKIFKILFISIICLQSVTAQNITQSIDSLNQNSENLKISNIEKTIEIDTTQLKNIAKFAYKPDPNRAIWLGIAIPGYGQIVNKKYWKLPFVYGGFMGFAYAISWNTNRYKEYKYAYRDIIDNDPTTNSFLNLLPKGYTMENFPGGVATYTNRLKSGYEQFRQYRDLSVLLSIGFYALVLIDAYVDAELYDFDISPNLVMNIQPATINYGINREQSAYGVQCNIKF